MITTELIGDRLVRVDHDGYSMDLTLDEARELLGDLDAVLPPISHEEAIAMFVKAFGPDQVEVVATGQMCALGCGFPITDRETYSEVLGYTRTQRKGGGSNQVALRKLTGRVAHEHCVVDAKKGGIGQQGMF